VEDFIIRYEIFASVLNSDSSGRRGVILASRFPKFHDEIGHTRSDTACSQYARSSEANIALYLRSSDSSKVSFSLQRVPHHEIDGPNNILGNDARLGF
jgi:hypothetical protein